MAGVWGEMGREGGEGRGGEGCPPSAAPGPHLRLQSEVRPHGRRGRGGEGCPPFTAILAS